VNQQTSHRGRHLVAADRSFATGGGLFARITAGGFHKLIDRVDSGLLEGSIHLSLPNGDVRILGGRGPGPDALVRLHSWRALVRLVTSGSVGWYKAWALGEWSSPDPVAIFELFSRNGEALGEIGRAKGFTRRVNRIAHWLRSNNRKGSRRNIAFHYDLGNDFYEAWLDRTMTYSSAIFHEPVSEAEPLEAAQVRKITTLLDRLKLRKDEHLLEIGCGWGGLAEIAARDFGVRVTGLTLSKEQKAFADRRLAAAGLGDRVSIEICDYRDVKGQFDAVASVEMVEAVGQEYWPSYLQTISRVLKDGRRAALQLISMSESLFEGYAANADFIQTYIFPGGLLINEPRFRALADKFGLTWQDRTGFSLHYAETLKRWRHRYNIAVAEERLPPGFDERFHNLWRYYLMYCEGGFRGGGIDVAQVTLEKRS